MQRIVNGGLPALRLRTLQVGLAAGLLLLLLVAWTHKSQRKAHLLPISGTNATREQPFAAPAVVISPPRVSDPGDERGALLIRQRTEDALSQIRALAALKMSALFVLSIAIALTPCCPVRSYVYELPRKFNLDLFKANPDCASSLFGTEIFIHEQLLASPHRESPLRPHCELSLCCHRSV